MLDLTYLMEIKKDTYRSDFDEIQFTISLILDLIRLIAYDIEGAQGGGDDTKMSQAFSKVRGCIGVIVPFERYIDSFNVLFEPFTRKLGIMGESDIFVGTPEMYVGVDKDVIIVAGVRNS